MDQIQFITAGNVDDGKSTLIGRLLLDTKSIKKDLFQEIKTNGDIEYNLASITDGLKKERELGITIDVAYRYFETKKRKFIIADCPGHEEYTKNFITGSSNADLIIILIDAENGITEQTRRHSLLAALMQIRHFVICINKMDSIEYDQKRYDSIVEDYKSFAAKLDVFDFTFIPISAKLGDNVVNKSKEMNWYDGATLLHSIENCNISSDENLQDCRFPVQAVVQDNFGEKIALGQICSGVFRVGDVINSSTDSFTISSIHIGEKSISSAFAPLSVSMQFEESKSIQPNDLLFREKNQPILTSEIDAILYWMGDEKLKLSSDYIIKHISKETKCLVEQIHYKLNVNTLHRNMNDIDIAMNDIARVIIRCVDPIFVDTFKVNKRMGAFILIDPKSNITIAAGVIK